MSTSASLRLWAQLQSALTGSQALPKLQMQCLGHFSSSSGRGASLTMGSLATSSGNIQLNTSLSAVVSSMSRLHTAGIRSMSSQASSLTPGVPSSRHRKHFTTNSSSILPQRAAVAVAAAIAGSNDPRSKRPRPRKVAPLNVLNQQQELMQQRQALQQQQQPQQPLSHSSKKLLQPAPPQPSRVLPRDHPGLLQVQPSQQQQQQQQLQQTLPVQWPFLSREPSQQEVYQHLKAIGSLLSDDQLSAVSDFLSELNEEQWEAVLCEAQHLRLIAGPGSGKTRTIAARVAWCLATNTPADQFLVITFTRKAAGELKERLTALMGKALVARLEPRTFHRFCNDLLRQYKHKSHVGDYGIATPDDAYKIIKGIVFPNGPPSKKDTESKGAKVELHEVPSSTVSVGEGPPQLTGERRSVDLSDVDGYDRKVANPIDMYQNAISKLKNFVPEIEGRSGSDLIQETLAAGYRLVPTELQPQIAYVYDRYQEQMRKDNLLDFDDLLHRCLHLVKCDEEVRRALHRRYHHVLVDESQDTNHCQFGLVHQVTGQQAKLLMVGDPDQAIYAFRGANSNLLSQVFLKQYPGTADTLYLSRNYRSRPPIIQVADIVRGQQRGSSSLYKAAECVRDHGSDHTVTLLQAEDQRKEMARMIEQVWKWHGAGYVWGDMALLFRTRNFAQDMYRQMLAVNIPCALPLGKEFWDSVEIKTAMTLLKCLVRPDVAGDDIKQRLIGKSGGKLSVPIMAGLGDTTIANLEKCINEQSSDSKLGNCLLGGCFPSDNTRQDAAGIVQRWLGQWSGSEAGPAQQAESSQVLEGLAPAWQPPEGFSGFKTKNAKAALAKLRGLVALGRAAAVLSQPFEVLKLMLEASGIWSVLQNNLAVDKFHRDAQRQTDNLGVLLDMAENTNAYYTVDADELEDADRSSLSSAADETHSVSSGSDDDDDGGSLSNSISPVSNNQQQTLQQLGSIDFSTAQQQPPVGMQVMTAFYDFCVLQGDGDKEGDSKSQKVQILTMHASKGKEFPCVGVMRVHEGMMPLIHKDDTTPNAIEQERNTLYVSLTRAKDHLVVSWPAQTVYYKKTPKGGYFDSVELQPSEFIGPVLAAVKAARLPGVVYWKHSADGKSTLVAGFPVGALHDKLTS